MFKKYNQLSLLLLVIISAVLSVLLYVSGASFLVAPIQMGDVSLGLSIASMAKDSLFLPLKPLMYALIILSIGSSLSISRGALGAKFVRVITFFVVFSLIGSVIAIIAYALFSDLAVFAAPSTISSGITKSIVNVPFALKMYGVLTSSLMVSIYAGVVFGLALKRLNLGSNADQLSDLFMSGFRQFLQVTIPLAVFGSTTLALNAPGGVQSLSNLLPLVGVYTCAMLFLWMSMVLITAVVLKRSPRFVVNAVAPQALVSLSTSSSIATLPATKIACEQLGNNGDESTPFFTIGATINMAGSLMGLIMLALFAMKAFGLPVDFSDMVVVALQSAIYSISIAGVPAASVVLLQDILVSQGVSGEYATYVTGIILTVDTLLLDRLRTTMNTQSDSMSTANGLHLYYKKPNVL